MLYELVLKIAIGIILGMGIITTMIGSYFVVKKLIS